MTYDTRQPQAAFLTFNAALFRSARMPPRPAWYAWVYFAVIPDGGVRRHVPGNRGGGTPFNPSLAWLLKCVLVMVSVVFLTTVYLRRDGLRWSRYGVSLASHALKRCALGLACGLALSLAWVVIVACWAPVSMAGQSALRWEAVVTGTLASFAMGIAEEVGYRSYGMERLRQDYGLIAALTIPTVIFVLAHKAGGVSWLPAVLVVGSSGLLYASLMSMTRSLPLVAGFHIANNVAQDALLRTSDGSLWMPVFRDVALAESHGPGIWTCMALLNVSIAAWAIKHRAHTA